MFLSVITFSFSASLLSVCCTHFRTLSLYTRLGEREVDEPSAVCNYLLGHRLLVSPVSPVAASHLSRLTITSSVRQLLKELVGGSGSLLGAWLHAGHAVVGRLHARHHPLTNHHAEE